MFFLFSSNASAFKFVQFVLCFFFLFNSHLLRVEVYGTLKKTLLRLRKSSAKTKFPRTWQRCPLIRFSYLNGVYIFISLSPRESRAMEKVEKKETILSRKKMFNQSRVEPKFLTICLCFDRSDVYEVSPCYSTPESSSPYPNFRDLLYKTKTTRINSCLITFRRDCSSASFTQPVQ